MSGPAASPSPVPVLTGRAIRDKQVDVLVLGGGMAGVSAALAAKAEDLSVAIAEPSNVLGGQGTAGGVAGFCGDSARTNRDFAELVARLAAIGRIDPYRPNDDRRVYDLELCAFVLQEMVDARGVEILLHSSAIDARMENGRVREVLLSCGPTPIRVRPKVVIDATGNAIVAAAVGLQTIGPGPNVQLPMSLYFTLWDTRAKVTPFLPEGCPRWERDEDLPMTSLHGFASGKVEVKMKVVGFDAADGESLARAEIHARRQMMGLIYHLQTRGYRGRHALNEGRPLDTYTLASVSRHIGQRQGRMIVGEYALTKDDVLNGRRFPDAVAVGTYHLDYHWPDTAKRAGTGITTMCEPHHLPLRAMIAKGADNLLAPGRSMCGDMMAFSSYRVMATCAQTGFAAGKAAQLAVRCGRRLQDLPIADLQASIAAGGQSLDLSDYGEYLRVLRFADEIAVPAISPKSLALARGRDNITVVLWTEMTSQRLMVACRRDGAWAKPATAAPLAAPARAIEACRLADGRIAALAVHDGERGASVLTSPDGETWTQVMTVERADNMALAGAAFGKPVADGAGLMVQVITRGGHARMLHLDLANAGARLSDAANSDDAGVATLRDHASRPDGAMAGIVAAERGVRAVLLTPAHEIARELAFPDVPAGAPCRVLGTQVGLALAWAGPEGVRVVEFPPERMAEPGAKPPSDKDLAMRPYTEGMHLVSA
jgi:FAD dependent oxidoreductase